MAELRNWFLSTVDGVLCGHGDVYYSEKIEDGKSIVTTGVNEITYLADRLVIKTKHSVYELPYAYHRQVEGIDTNVIPVEYLQGKEEALDISRWTEGAVDERREQEKAEMISLIDPAVQHAAVLRFSHQSAYYYLAMLVKKANNYIYTDSYTVRPGTYKDTVLIDGTIPGTHFAYYPEYGKIEFFSWDKDFDAVYLENTGVEDLEFITPLGTVSVKAGSCKVVSK